MNPLLIDNKTVEVHQFSFKPVSGNIISYVYNHCRSHGTTDTGTYILSAESQKGAIADQRCSIENQKGAIAIDFVQQ